MAKFEIIDGFPKEFEDSNFVYFNVPKGKNQVAGKGVIGIPFIQHDLALTLYDTIAETAGLAHLTCSDFNEEISNQVENLLSKINQTGNYHNLEAFLAGEKDDSQRKISPIVIKKLNQYQISITGADLGGKPFFGRTVFIFPDSGNVKIYRFKPFAIDSDFPKEPIIII
jgi:hypothetical protein